MLGDEPPMMPGMGGMFPGLPPGGRGGRGGRGAAPGTPPATNPQQITPNLALMVIQSGASYGWRSPEKDQVANQLGIRFGYNASGDLYYPADAPPDAKTEVPSDANTTSPRPLGEGPGVRAGSEYNADSKQPPAAKLPVVIWLHGYGYAMGYEWGYRRDLSPILALVKAGYAVFAFDQMGFGSRIAEAGRFYDRYPHWSELGRMVEDTRAAIDMLEKREHIDPEKIYLFGYSTLGGTLGLYTAALDSRVKGVVSICSFTPMRTDTADRGTGGIARYSHIHGLLPRLGFFVGNESRIPYDYQDLIAAIAPRPVYILAPQLDRDTTPADVRTAVESARKVFSLYNASDKLILDAPWDYNRLPEATQDRIVKWMKENMK